MGRNVLIIGASGEIGRAVYKQIAADGDHLILHYYQNKQGLQFTDIMQQESILMEIKADLSTANGVNHLLNQLTLPVDAVVFAGGKAHTGLFQDTDDTIMDSMLTLHVKAPWQISRHILPHMIARKQGNIIMITSIWGEVGASHEVVYSSVKGAQNSFIKALAKETAPSGISVNAVSPGFIDTKMNEHLLPEEKEAIIQDIPAGRAGTVEDVAHAVSFLMNEKSGYINGEIIHVTGGWLS
ncbi:EF-P-5 aminopentanone reductase [Lentibacillus halophilus]|uniref:EF-P-5 aminopentanone reductase n=1 Tax=Lentibacillus halophilus TaxID=295065 RepID=A0ABN0ZEY1_9BACI